ncbi:MAG: O-antigen ligase domain-containing protein [Deltaproteobacteria bacterium]|nr:MAG: O-antigen ligase domain-containing protein [Deltaproteobacteria bacterium]
MGPLWPASTSRAFGNSEFLTLVAAAGLLAVASGSILALPPIAVLVPVVAASVAGALFIRPEQAILAAVALRCIVDLTWKIQVGPLNAMEAYTGAAVVGVALLCLMHLRRVGASEVAVPAVILTTLVAVAFVRDPGIDGVSRALKLVAPWTLMLIVPVLVRTPQRLLLLLRLMFFASLPAVAISFAFGLTGRRFARVAHVDRLLGGYLSVTEHASTMFLFVMIGVFFAFRAERMRERAIYAAYTAAALTGLYLSYTRAAYIGLAFGMLALLGLNGRWRLLVVASALLGGLALQSPVFSERFSELTSSVGAAGFEDTARDLGSGRYWIWSHTFAEYLREDPFNLVLGRGLGGNTRHSLNIDPHMDALHILYQIGPLGLVAWGWALSRAFVGAIAGRRSEAPLVSELSALLIAIAVGCLVNSMLTNAFISRAGPAWYFGAVLGGMLAIPQMVAAAAEVRSPSLAPVPASPVHSRAPVAPSPSV